MARSRRQVVLMRKPGAKASDGMTPMGSRKEVHALLARFNTAADGGQVRAGAGTEFLHGPGMVVELPLGVESIAQAMVTMNEEEIAMPVLLKICKELAWQMVDLETGRAWG